MPFWAERPPRPHPNLDPTPARLSCFRNPRWTPHLSSTQPTRRPIVAPSASKFTPPTLMVPSLLSVPHAEIWGPLAYDETFIVSLELVTLSLES